MLDDADIQRTGRTLAAHASFPSTVILFGSRARGDHGPGSDLDFLVIEDQPVEDRIVEAVRLRDAVGAVGVGVDIVVLSREEAERRRQHPGSMVKRAFSQGRVLVEP